MNIPATLDEIDCKILDLLQHDSMLPVSDIAKAVNLSTTPCWRRIQKLVDTGVITKRVALLNPEKLLTDVTVFVSVTATEHSEGWYRKFVEVIADMPEVVEFYRMSGDIDYLMRVVVPDIAAYDRFYQSLVSKIRLHDVVSRFAMETIKYTTALPLTHIRQTISKRERDK